MLDSLAKMNLDFSRSKKRVVAWIYASHYPLTIALSSSLHGIHSYRKDSNTSSSVPASGNKISPAVIFIIIVLAVVVFISGLLHLLVRFLRKQPSSSSSFQPGRYPEVPGSDALQRQLQQLFHLHDSGLDQTFIDSLPVFLYKEIMGLKEPFDCAVCLSEFSEEDKLRLLPPCGHAFHINCIDAWLLSNSTCPLCRFALHGSALSFENPIFYFDDAREEDRFAGAEDDGNSGGQKSAVDGNGAVDKRVFSVRLGKFSNFSAIGGAGETSSSNFDGRRCYSMGSYQYVVGDSELQVTFYGRGDGSDAAGGKGKQKQINRSRCDENFSIEMDVEGKKLSGQNKGESFSISKIWQWSKKEKHTTSSDTNFSNGISSFPSNLNLSSPWIERT